MLFEKVSKYELLSLFSFRAHIEKSGMAKIILNYIPVAWKNFENNDSAKPRISFM